MTANPVTAAINKVKAKAIAQQVFGWLIAVFNGLITFVGLTQIKGASDVALVVFFAGLTSIGVLLITKGGKKKKLIKTFYEYSARLAVDPEKSIDLLASSTGVSTAVATKNISDMIAFGFFPSCFLDGQNNRLVIPATPQGPRSATSSPQSMPAPCQAAKYVTIQCKGCGAINKIIAGTVGECEFCGSQISE